jgi:hypothetical protein
MFMHQRCRLAGASAAALTALSLAACTAESEAEAEASAATPTQSAVYGDPDIPVLPEPTFVATDPPVTLAPTTAGSLFVTYSGWNEDSGAVEVGSYLPDASESDGTCTLTLTKGATSVDVSGSATPDVTSTACGDLTVPGDQLSPGDWTAVVTYESSTSRGASDPVEVEVP